MSKIDFSSQVYNIIYNKINALDSLNLNELFSYSELFDVSLCLSYLTLSKEKIIKKDIKNTDRINRLTKLVDISEINKLFNPNFNKELPNIIYTKENNNLWILDNIRDSIMHGVFDIDLDRKCFIINNTQFDRELNAEIPFSWFIAYAKNDILKKKISNKYNVRGFYYNKKKKNLHSLNMHKEFINNILYNVYLSDVSFNTYEIEKRIKELFDYYSKEEYTEEEKNNYMNLVNINSYICYNQDYLLSFYIVRDKVRKQIENEYPGINISITIINNKKKIMDKAIKKTRKFYNNYDLMMDEFDKAIDRKSYSLLNYLSNIITNLDNVRKMPLNDLELEREKCIINYLLENDIDKYTKRKDINLKHDRNIQVLYTILLNVLGVSTLVTNQEEIYNNYFKNTYAIDYKIFACSRQPYLDYLNKRKSLFIKELDLMISLYPVKKQYNNCPIEKVKLMLDAKIKDIERKIENIENELTGLMSTLNIQPIIQKNLIDYNKLDDLYTRVGQLFNHFERAKTDTDRRKIKDVIKKVIDNIIEEEISSTYAYTYTMEDTLTIIRNSFSHIGRINIEKDFNGINFVRLNDFDNNNIKSGEVTCNIRDLIDMLGLPLNTINKKLIKK